MFLSVVSRTSNPSASAAANNSPLESLSHPRSIASTTVWPSRACLSGAGTPLSKRTSIYGLSGKLPSNWRVKTARREFEHGYHLFPGEMEPVHNLVYGGSRFQVLEDCGNGRSGISEYP